MYIIYNSQLPFKEIKKKKVIFCFCLHSPFTILFILPCGSKFPSTVILLWPKELPLAFLVM